MVAPDVDIRAAHARIAATSPHAAPRDRLAGRRRAAVSLKLEACSTAARSRRAARSTIF